MQQEFTIQFMEENRGCYTDDQLSACSFMQLTVITLDSILRSEIQLKDKFWFVCKKLATKEENQQIVIRAAELVLPIYEKHYPDDRRPREAIEAAKAFIAGTIGIEELHEKKSAAYSAVHVLTHIDASYEAYETSYAAGASTYSAETAFNGDAASTIVGVNCAIYATYGAKNACAVTADLEKYLLSFVEK